MNANKILNYQFVIKLVPFIFRKSREETFNQSESSLKNGQDLSTVVPTSHFPYVLSKQKKASTTAQFAQFCTCVKLYKNL